MIFGGSVIRSGLLDRVKASLENEGISYIELGGVKPNPRSGLVYQGIDLCRENGIDFILAVGGGSTIDSAKAGIEALRSFLISIGMPKNFEELGAKEEDIPKLAHMACYGRENSGGKVVGFTALDQNDVEAIYRLML